MAAQLPDDRPSIRVHKHQFAWQIIVPVVVLAGLIIAGAVLVITGGTSRTSAWADVSLIWLLVPAIMLAFIFIAVAITIIYGMSKILMIIPLYSGKTQGLFNKISSETRKVADGATKPFIWYKQAGAVIKSLFKW